MPTSPHAITDRSGRVLFHCSSCHAPLSMDDFFDLGLRMPDDGESMDDYCSAELLDEISHVDCARAARAG